MSGSRSARLTRKVLICGLAWLAAVSPGTADDSVEGQYLSNVRQLTFEYVKAGEGYFSPDGASIVYQAVPKGYPFYQIFAQALEGGPARRISTGRGRTTCAYFSPDGESILFASSHLDPELTATENKEREQQAADAASGKRRRYDWAFDPYMEIFTVDVQGGNLQRLTDSLGYDAECSYSPDGQQIVFCSDRDGDADLYIMQADGTGVRQLTNSTGYDGGPFFSPDGQWVVFRSDRKKPEFLQIYAIRTDGSQETALTDNVGVNWAPYWHPSKPYLIWTGADHSDPQARPNYDLWLMHYERSDAGISPGPITRITDHPTADVLPVFSRDASHLMWTSNRTSDGSSQLWYADIRMPE